MPVTKITSQTESHGMGLYGQHEPVRRVLHIAAEKMLQEKKWLWEGITASGDTQKKVKKAKWGAKPLRY